MEIPVLYYNIDGSQVFRHEILKDLFEKVGPCPFSVVSVNGFRKTGKSFLLTQILRTFSPELPEVEWTRAEGERTVALSVWSEPIKYTDSEDRVAFLILLKTKTSLEPPATLHQNAAVSALSLALSSLLILNLRKTINKENLAFLQYYISLAKALQEGPFQQNFKFQRILFLIRDMELRVKDFSHGYHAPGVKPPATAHSQTNLFTQIFSIDPTRQPLEIQHTYKQVLSSFTELGLFALPESVPLLLTNYSERFPPLSSNHSERMVDLEFHNYVQALLDLLLGGSGILVTERKIVDDLEVKGVDFQEAIDLWARRLKNSQSEESICSRDQSRAEMLNRISTSNLLSLYVSTITDFLGEHGRRTGKSWMYQKTLAEKMNSFLKICLDTFSRRLSQGDEGLKNMYREILSSGIEVKMKLFESLNESRLKYGREVGALRSEVNDLLEQLEALRHQKEETETDKDEDDLERRLRSARLVHLRKQSEEHEGRLLRLQEKVEETQIENQKNLDQITNLINSMSNLY